jgi:DNA-binding NarL/FixJ family response regulator
LGNKEKPLRSKEMRNHGIIIATGAGFLAETLRDKLREFGTGPVVTARNEHELRAGIGYSRIVFLEHCFRGAGTEEYLARLAPRAGGLRIAVWSAAAVKPVIAARYMLAGAESYFSLREGEEKIGEVLRAVLSGRRYCPAEVKAVLDSDTYFPDMGGKLTVREREIVKLSVTGRNNREIGEALGIRAATVKYHKAGIYRKCGGDTPVDILRYGLSLGVIRAEDLITHK